MDLLKLLDGKDVQVGVIDVASDEIETPEEVAAVIGEAAKYVAKERIIAGTNCGMAPMRRDIASASSKRWARARSWHGRNSADFAAAAAAGYLVAGQFLERAVASSTLSSSVAET